MTRAAATRVLASAAAGLLALLASACVSIAPNGLSAGDTANLRFTSFEVTSAPAADIRWSAAEDEYLASRNLSTTDPALTRTPEARGYVEMLAAKRLRAALERRLAARAAGTRPVRVVATIRGVSIPSAAQRVLIGGNPAIAADIEIVDARSGAVLTRYTGDAGRGGAGAGALVLVDAALMAGGGDDLYDRAANDYARRFEAWLSGA